MLPTEFQVSWLFDSEEEAKHSFQNDGHGGHLVFPIGTSPMLPTKFQVNWPRGVGGVGF